MKDLTASIVLFKNDAKVVAHAIHSFLSNTANADLYLIDNSPTDELKYLAYDPRIKYFFQNSNIGFGSGHNIAIREIIDRSTYHLVLNPDVYFEGDVINSLYMFMEEHQEVGQVMPKVLYPDGRIQHLCKLLPSPKTLIMRRFLNFLKAPLKKENYLYELQFTGYNTIMDVPFLSGCFMFLRTDALKKVGLFDERFFLYTEDTDLTRRIHKHFRTVFFPNATIYHHHQRGSYKTLRLMFCNIASAIKYFNKWGWTSDTERNIFNERALLQLKTSQIHNV
jgi:GT2 family glycosyltransferase